MMLLLMLMLRVLLVLWVETGLERLQMWTMLRHATNEVRDRGASAIFRTQRVAVGELWMNGCHSSSRHVEDGLNWW